MQQYIMIVTESRSHLLMSIKTSLEHASNNVIMVPSDTDAINGVKESVSGILIFADSKLAEQLQPLHFLKDRAIAFTIPIFIVGSEEEISAIKGIIPKELVHREFVRPLKMHVSNLVDAIDGLVKQNSMKKKKKILVVDDSGAMLRNVKGWLEDKYEVFLANSGAMAIKYLALNRPDLVLLDYEMPVVDGRQVLEMIRSEMDFSDIPVMFLTGKGDKESFMSVKELKPEGYLLKTTEPALIVKSVDDFFELRKAFIK